MRIKTLSLAPLALALTACMTVGPDYRAPEQEPVVVEQAKALPLDTSRLERTWWRQFGDENLNALVAEALDNNRELRIAFATLRAARARFDDSANDRLPTVTAGVGHEHGKAQQPGLSEARIERESYRAGLDLAWEVDLFGRVQRVIESADAEAGAAEAALRDTQVSLVAELVRTYGHWRGAQARVAVAERNRDNQAQTLRITEARLADGEVTELDVASASARLAATEAAMPALRLTIVQAENRLALLTGHRPGEAPLALAARPVPTAAAPIAIGDPATLLRRRPDIARVERELAAATARVGVATADLFPRLSVSGFIGFLAGNGSELGSAGSRAWSVAPSLSWPALDLGAVRARLRAAEAQADGALAAYEHSVLAALAETETAFAGYGAAQQRLAHSDAQVAASRRAAELARIRYQEGAVDALVLLDAEREQLAAEDGQAQARVELYAGVVGIYKALGGGWDPGAGA
ncbi:MAG: TolC family protein [Gammaproteobacteria bacterium]|nr:TolC family protein [Gammaproteobacteria bacterium]